MKLDKQSEKILIVDDQNLFALLVQFHSPPPS